MAARLELLDLVQGSADRRRGPERHEADELIAVLNGRYEVRVEGRRLTAVPGEIVLMPAHTEHRAQLSQEHGVRIHVLQWTGASALAIDGPTVLVDSAGRILFLLDWLRQAHGVDAKAARTSRRLLALLLDEVARLLAGTTGGEDAAVRRALRYMESDLHRGLSVAEIAAAAGLSPSQLVRRMRRAIGRSPGQELLRMRAAAAIGLLRGTDLRQAEIARRVGLHSAAHLNRLVRRHAGRTPGAVRRGGS